MATSPVSRLHKKHHSMRVTATKPVHARSSTIANNYVWASLHELTNTGASYEVRVTALPANVVMSTVLPKRSTTRFATPAIDPGTTSYGPSNRLLNPALSSVTASGTPWNVSASSVQHP